MMFALILFFIYGSDVPDVAVCRSMMDHAVEDKKLSMNFYQQLKTVKEGDAPVMLGFRAMSEFLMCKHLVNPFSRLSHFNKGRSYLEKAISKHPGHPELLLFRLSTQSHVPAVLNYNSHMDSDKRALIAYLQKYSGKKVQDPVLYKRIKAYLLQHKYCSEAEKESIKTL